MSEPRPIEISPFCKLLRSKKIAFLEMPPRTKEDVLDGSGTCWCQKTMGAVGPDGRPVHPEHCRSSRACFEPFGPRT